MHKAGASLCLALILVFLPAMAHADTYPVGDMTAFNVVAADLPTDATGAGLDKDALAATATAALKKGGMQILDEAGPPGTGTFQISIGAVNGGGEDQAYAVRCEVGRLVYFFKQGDMEKKNPIVGKQFVRGIIWSDMFSIAVPKAQAKQVITDTVKQSAEKFVQDWNADRAEIAKEPPPPAAAE